MSSTRRLGHFLLIGALLFAFDRWLGATADAAAHKALRVSAEEVERLGQGLRSRTGQAPGPEELRAEIERFVDEEILFREALALGLERTDAVVQQRLVRNLRFLGAGPERDDASLLREAFALGLERSDLVVRRRLVQRMRLALAASAREEPITTVELHAYRETNAQRFMEPARVRGEHVFLSRERRGAALQGDALVLRAQLEVGDAPRAAALGDPFLHGHTLRSASARDLEGTFGAGFAAAVFSLEPGRWSEPIASAYGLHLVRLHEKQPSVRQPFEAVRDNLTEALLVERERAVLRAALRELRKDYAVEVALR